MPYVTIAGEKIFYLKRARGEEESLLFIHGAGESHRLWGHQVQHVKAVNTYAVDLPGHGRSAGEGRQSIAAYGQFVLSFLDALGLAGVTLVGHSMGGAITLHLALHCPARLRGIVLVGTGARLRVMPAILDGLREDFPKTVRLICRYAYASQADEALVRQGEVEMLQNRPEVLHGDFVACDQFDVMERLGEIRCPTLVICGGEDRLTPPKYSTYLRDHIAGAQLILIEGAGHMVMVERPTVTSRAISQFISTLSP